MGQFKATTSVSNSGTASGAITVFDATFVSFELSWSTPNGPFTPAFFFNYFKSQSQ